MMKLTQKAQRFLDAVRVLDNKIELEDLEVESTLKGNWTVYHKGERITTLSANMLDDETVQAFGLERHAIDEARRVMLFEQFVNETGEWDDNDEEMSAWLNELKKTVKKLEKELGQEIFDVKSVKGFDKYQGPYATVRIGDQFCKVWMFQSEILFVEGFPVDNSKEYWKGKSQDDVMPGFYGTAEDVMSAVKNLK